MSRSLVKQGEPLQARLPLSVRPTPSWLTLLLLLLLLLPCRHRRGACAQETLHLAAWRKWCALPRCAPCAPRASRHGVCTPGWLVVTPVCLPARAA
jgi:hypothetical protein